MITEKPRMTIFGVIEVEPLSGRPKAPVGITTGLLVALLIPWLVGVSLLIILLPPFTHNFAVWLVDTENSAVSHAELVDTADAGLAFVTGQSDWLPRGWSYRFAFTDDAVSHLEDVRSILYMAKATTVALSILVVLLAVIVFVLGRAAALGRALRIAAVLTMALVAVLVLAGWLNFDWLFTTMHSLLFAEGTWMFYGDSLLLTAYPLPFWIAMAASWAVVLAVLCLVIGKLGRILTSR